MPESKSSKPGFIGENAKWVTHVWLGFLVVGVVLTGIILFFR